MATTDFIAAIELSSSKLTGIAGQKNSDGSLQVLAYATEDASAFIRKGVIVNIDKTAQALESVIKRLERQLGKSIAKVYAGIGGQSLRTVSNTVSRTLEQEGVISQELIDSICDENRNTPLADMNVLDVAPQEYRIDNTAHIDPVGVAGQHITGQFLNIVARATLKKNMELSFGQAAMEMADDFIVAPLAMARAVLTESEMRSGCALVDFGADTTTVMVFQKNLLRHLSVIPLGGNNITLDITSLKMEEAEAESLKLKYGNILYEEEENPAESTCTTEDGRTVELTKLNDIIGARAEEILSNVWEQIKFSGCENSLLSGVVFTGGGSNLKNLEEAFRKISKAEKVKTAGFVRMAVRGCSDSLPQDGTQNTLLGLLNWGHENCCKPEPKPEPMPGIVEEPQDMFKYDEALEESRRRFMETEKQKKEEEKRRREEEKRRREEEKKNKPSWWKTIKNVATEAGNTLFDGDDKMD